MRKDLWHATLAEVTGQLSMALATGRGVSPGRLLAWARLLRWVAAAMEREAEKNLSKST